MNTTTISGDDDDDVHDATPYFPAYGHYAVGSVLATVFVLGTISNGLGLITFIKCKHLRSPTNTFILSLLVGDFCMCCFGVPMAMTSSFSTRWIWGKTGCDIEGFLVYFFGMANMYSLCAISLDRYVVIALPLHSSKITHRVAALSVFLCWFGGFFWAVVPFFGWSYYHLEAAHTSCSVVWESDDPTVVSYNMTIFVFCFILPVGLMMFAYFNVYMTIRNVARNNVWDMTSRIARKNLAIEKKMFKTIVIMVSLFMLAWTPYAIVSFWAVFIGSGGIPVVIQTIPAIAAKCSSIFNPFVYVATNKQFRTAFYSIIPCTGIREKLREAEENKPEKSDDEGEGDTHTKTKKQPTATDRKINQVHPIEETQEAETQMDEFERSSPAAASHRKNSNVELQEIENQEEA